MNSSDTVDLASSPSFTLGRLRIDPSLRQLTRDDGTTEVLEHRVMQVLVALTQAKGAIVSRNALTIRCWESRVVGEDAINRVISRLRKLENGIGKGSFRIETITRIGYRLTAAEYAPTRPTGKAPNRRLVVFGAGALAAVAAGALVLTLHPSKEEATAPPEVAPLMAQAMVALRQESPEGNDQAIGLLRRILALRPDYADGWGALAFAYSLAFHGRGERNFEAMFARSRAAAGRALELDPRNGYARAAIEMLRPYRGHWLERERGFRAAIDDHPELDLLLQRLSAILLSVGRNREASELLDRAVAAAEPSPSLLYLHARALWAAERFEDADQAIERATALYPTHYAIWFTRYYILLYSGRADQALAFGAERARRPSGIAEGEFDNIFAVARAMMSRRPGEIDEAIRRNLANAPRGAGYAENMIQFASALGRQDTAFLVANAYYFDRGFQVADFRFDAEQRSYSPHGDRNTDILFFPSTSAMRGDPRMAGLWNALGLARYWAEAGVRPDFQRRQT